MHTSGMHIILQCNNALKVSDDNIYSLPKVPTLAHLILTTTLNFTEEKKNTSLKRLTDLL